MKDHVENLGKLICASREEILTEWRHRVLALDSASGLDVPSLNDHVPMLIKDIASAFVDYGESESDRFGAHSGVSDEQDQRDEAGADSASEHGFQRYSVGFDLAEVIAEYGIFRDVIFDFAARQQVQLTPEVISSVNSVLDLAISRAVRVYAGLRAAELRKEREKHLEFVVHDLRAPLNVIQLCVTRLAGLMQTDNLDSQVQPIVPMLDRNAGRLVRLVDEILAAAGDGSFESSRTVHLREVQIWPVVEQLCLETYPIMARQGGQILNQVDPQATGYLDAPMFTRVVQNLLSNAVKAARDGVVRVRTEPGPEPGYLCLIISNDTGVMPESQRQRLLRDMESGPDTGEGRGLSIIRQFVLAMNGRIAVNADSATGTSISVALPTGATSSSSD